MVEECCSGDFGFMRLVRDFLETRLVYRVSVSNIANQNYKAAEVTKWLFKEHQLDLSCIIFERESHNAWENCLFIKSLEMPKGGERWVLISTAWHMPRLVYVFRKLGWHVVPYPLEFQTTPDYLLTMSWNLAVNLAGLVTTIRAWVGHIGFRLTGES